MLCGQICLKLFGLKYGRASNIWTEYLSMTEEIADVFKAESAIPHFFSSFSAQWNIKARKKIIVSHFCMSI